MMQQSRTNRNTVTMNMMDTTTYCAPRAAATTLWQSFAAAAFSSPPITTILPPPMRTNYYTNVLSPGLSSILGIDVVGGYTPKRAAAMQPSPTSLYHHASSVPTAFAFRTPSLFGVSPNNKSSSIVSNARTSSSMDEPSSQKQTSIAIIGGGIAGVTAANALGKKFADDKTVNAKVVVFEGDVEGGHRCVNFGNCEQPTWIAATARNANSLVPGAAMHVMSQRKTLFTIFKDITREFYSEQVESFQHFLHDKGHIDYRITKSIDNFDVAPPYFALHLFRCIGPSATWDERATFITFLKNFLMTSVFSGEAQANERGKYMQQLAKSNRFSFLEAINNGGEDGKALAKTIGLGQGFLSLHRTSQDAIHAFNEGKLFGETSFIMPLEEAIKLEPRISNLPIKNQLFAVHRVDDYTANSALFVQDLIKKIQGRGVEYRCGNVGTVKDITRVKDTQHQKSAMSSSPTTVVATAPAVQKQHRFKIATNDGLVHDFDYIVLAAGVNTPLLARKLSVGELCPTYPLRGYSFTIYTYHTHEHDSNDRVEKGRSTNLLNMPISIDDMYCSSVGVNMARMAGFGELVGYRDKAVDVPSLAPRVMARYTQSLFPESNITEDNALQCFRPMSPDDLPIVGQVKSKPGLFFHTGHGTLGWTLCLATSECLAQALYDDMKGNETHDTYQLPGNITVDRAMLSPNRFL